MPTVFELICEDFNESLDSILHVVGAFDSTGAHPKTRIASINSSTLFLAATFEEFVRQEAREFARKVVSSAGRVENLPDKFSEAVWKRSLDGVNRQRFGRGRPLETLSAAAADAQRVFNAVFAFMAGDISQNIYDHLIHNENNMRYGEINSLFKVSGLSTVCMLVSAEQEFLSFFQETDPNKSNGKFMEEIDKFMERRNEIAHALSSVASVAPDVIRNDVAMFRAFSLSLARVLGR